MPLHLTKHVTARDLPYELDGIQHGDGDGRRCLCGQCGRRRRGDASARHRVRLDARAAVQRRRANRLLLVGSFGARGVVVVVVVVHSAVAVGGRRRERERALMLLELLAQRRRERLERRVHRARHDARVHGQPNGRRARRLDVGEARVHHQLHRRAVAGTRRRERRRAQQLLLLSDGEHLASARREAHVRERRRLVRIDGHVLEPS